MRGPQVSEKRDFYEVLEVSRTASQTEIKSAYRKLARKHHPDANPGDRHAEERFKAVNEAYGVLSDPEKRSLYDRFGHAGIADAGGVDFGAGMDPFGLFDLFMGTGRGSRRQGPEPGADLRCDVELTLEEAATGASRSIPIARLESCGRCGGSGARPDSPPQTCTACRGTGQVRSTQNTFLGAISTVTSCHRCRGQGRVIQHPCVQCHGEGVERKRRTVEVKIPAGIDDGQRVVLRGEGESGPAGGPSGDLYVFVRVRRHAVFERHGRDLICEVETSVVRSALGGSIDVPTLAGPQRIQLRPGTQPGDVFKIRGQGMPEPNRPGRGDLMVVVRVRIPEQLNDRQRQALQALAAASGDEDSQPEGGNGAHSEGAGLFEWVRNVFGGKAASDR